MVYYMLDWVHITANLTIYIRTTPPRFGVRAFQSPPCDACAQGLNLKHVFPRIRWMSASSVKVWHVSKGGSVTNDHAFKLTDGPDMYLPMPNRSELRK